MYGDVARASGLMRSLTGRIVVFQLERSNVSSLDTEITHKPAFQQTISGYVWVRAGWGPYTALLTKSSPWDTYFPYGQDQDRVVPRGIAFHFEVYGRNRTWYGGFLVANGNYLGGGNIEIHT